MTKINWKKPVNNKHLSATFHVFFFVFFFIFVANRYTMNLVMATICLIYAVSFKTWQILREVQECQMKKK